MRLAIGVVLLLASGWASATSTKCSFSPSSTAPVPTLEFLGYEKVSSVLIFGAGGPMSLPAGSWKLLDFDERSMRVHFVFTNPGDKSLPPSFAVKGRGKHAWLTVGSRTYRGEFLCGAW